MILKLYASPFQKLILLYSALYANFAVFPGGFVYCSARDFYQKLCQL